MDVYSEVLRAIRLEGALFFNGEFTAPWCFLSPEAKSVMPRLAPSSSRLIIYHFLTEGRAYVRLPGGERAEMVAGDIVILPQGDAHFLGNGSPEVPVDPTRTFAKDLSQGMKVTHFGGGGEASRFVCGYMACDSGAADVLLDGLPKLLIVHLANEPASEWLAQSIRFSVGDDGAAGAGRGLVLSKLAEVLFVETLRRYIAELPSAQTGWLAGIRDPGVGRALTLLHRDPARPWTLADLARETGVSRTLLAERFRHFLGQPPMAYLASWRLKMGAGLLRQTSDSVADVAFSVGYGSESAFNRAFRREFGAPPAQFRKGQRDVGPVGAAMAASAG